mgnify:FL=1
MTEAEAIAAVVAATGNRRLGQLLDPTHPDHDRRFWLAVWPLVSHLIDTPPAVVSLSRRIARCPHWRPGPSCCEGWSCLRDAPDAVHAVRLDDCEQCKLLQDSS